MVKRYALPRQERPTAAEREYYGLLSHALASHCLACGDPIVEFDQRVLNLRHEGYKVSPRERFYCAECADEILRGRVDVTALGLPPGAIGRTGPGRLHVGFVFIPEDDEHLANLRRHFEPATPDSVARSRIGATDQVLCPIDRVARRVAPPPPSRPGAGGV